ncbi:hypothetical protein LOZ53_006164 [Ophidiomyces ophidiicola]|nr:hypothetical protein LOZ62_004072 [Ophidiomyces ophidiicola]KAI1948635.1 hypothetical protein LOZ59_006315 [Ophidiomyces ophidiicola]KAI1969586.1 hypothetical protein LOZ56_004290 [Ophidiomyces ophidiicola]KAI1972153.1 hypothetical protein LOZ55_005917 [Ophidiomyces ophidiicola]KAI1982783.1 hypothetical protein LOZ53_006164 [Ophidiomyces ophidiicola]
MEDQVFNALQKSNDEAAGNAALVKNLFLKFSIQSRISIVVIATFNVFASIVVVGTILYDSWRLAGLRVPRRRLEFLTTIPTAHVFSNALAISTIIQGTAFISVQAMGLQGVRAAHCPVYSQITWTATWVVAYTILVFSFEAAFRSISPTYSTSPCRNSASVHWLIVIVLLLLTWLPSHFRPVVRRVCNADLTQWMAPWADIGTAITSATILFFLLNAATLSIRLRRPGKMSLEQQIATRNQIYYLVVNAVIFVFTLPFWIELTTFRSTNVPAMMMSIVINLFGIVNGVLFLLLRASGQNIITRSANPIWFMKAPRRYTDSTEFAVAQQMIMPVGLERNNSAVKQENFMAKRFTQRLMPESPFGKEKTFSGAMFPDGRSSMERLTEHVQNRQSYSTSNDSSPGTSSILSMTDIDDQILLPPQPYFSHRRRSSDISAATVQIGLCLSGIPVPLPAQQTRSSSRLANLPIHIPSRLLPSRFSSVSNPSSPRRRKSLDSHATMHPLQVNPPSPSNRLPGSPQSIKQNGLPPNPKLPQTTQRELEANIGWPLSQDTPLLPNKAYSQTRWI